VYVCRIYLSSEFIKRLEDKVLKKYEWVVAKMAAIISANRLSFNQSYLYRRKVGKIIVHAIVYCSLQKKEQLLPLASKLSSCGCALNYAACTKPVACSKKERERKSVKERKRELPGLSCGSGKLLGWKGCGSRLASFNITAAKF